MKKILLVIDEIQLLHGLETFLRRLGFDVLSLGRDVLVTDALLSFVPEIVIASGRGRQVDGLKLAQKIKKTVVPVPRTALCFSGAAPSLSANDLKNVDALLELPLAGEQGLKLLAQLAGLPAEPLLDKFRKFSGAKLTVDEQIVIVTGAPAAPAPTSVAAAGTPTTADWDPKKNPGKAAEIRTERSNRYDQLLAKQAGELETAVSQVMPRARAQEAMAKLKKDSESEKSELDRIQAEKIKFAETLFDEGEKKK